MQPHRNPLHQVAGVVLFAVTTLCAPAEEWVLTFDVKEDRVTESPDGKGASKTQSRTYQQIVALGADYLVVQDGDRTKTVFDFAGRRMRTAFLTAGTRNDWSLYHLPTFLEHELSNRAMLGAAMRSAGIPAGARMFDRFESESDLRVVLPSGRTFDLPAPLIEKVPAAGGLEFRHDGRTIVRFTPAPQPLPEAWRHRFVNFLAYSCRFHPEIRRAIAATGSVPQVLEFTWRTAAITTTRSLHLVSAATASTDSSTLPEGLVQVRAKDPLEDVLDVVRDASESAGPRDAAAVVEFANQAIDANRPLDAVLALLEYGLQTGEQLTDELRRHRDVFNRDADCQAYLGAFGQADKATAEKNLAINAKINRQGLRKAHMLDLQRANLLEAAGRPREALEAFFAVLRANPRHAGALHDLGWIYFRNFEHEKAWRCWEPARRLYSGHPMLRDVIRLEMDVVRNQPDFF